MIKKKQPPYLNFIIVLFFLVTALAIITDPSKSLLRDPLAPKFDTTDASRIYFKNMRRYYYDLEVNKADKKELYRFRKRTTSIQDRPILNVCIVQDPALDMAFVLLELNDFSDQKRAFQLTRENTESGITDTLEVELWNVTSHYQFCTHIYNSIINEEQLNFIQDDVKYPILNKANEKEAFRKSMRDFYKLTEMR